MSESGRSPCWIRNHIEKACKAGYRASQLLRAMLGALLDLGDFLRDASPEIASFAWSWPHRQDFAARLDGSLALLTRRAGFLRLGFQSSGWNWEGIQYWSETSSTFSPNTMTANSDQPDNWSSIGYEVLVLLVRRSKASAWGRGHKTRHVHRIRLAGFLTGTPRGATELCTRRGNKEMVEKHEVEEKAEAFMIDGLHSFDA